MITSKATAVLAMLTCFAGGVMFAGEPYSEQWFVENVETIGTAMAGDGRSADGVWANYGGQATVGEDRILVNSTDVHPLSYVPSASTGGGYGRYTEVEMTINFDCACNGCLGDALEDIKAAIMVVSNSNEECVFAVADNGQWVATDHAAVTNHDYLVKCRFEYSEVDPVTVVYWADGEQILDHPATVPYAMREISRFEFAGKGSFSLLESRRHQYRVGVDGVGYDSTDEALASIGPDGGTVTYYHPDESGGYAFSAGAELTVGKDGGWTLNGGVVLPPAINAGNKVTFSHLALDGHDLAVGAGMFSIWDGVSTRLIFNSLETGDGKIVLSPGSVVESMTPEALDSSAVFTSSDSRHAVVGERMLSPSGETIGWSYRTEIILPETRKLAEHFYETEYADFDYPQSVELFGLLAKGGLLDGTDAFSSKVVAALPKVDCAACRTGGIVGRNLDWDFNGIDEYLLRMPAVNGVRHGSVGIAVEFFPKSAQGELAEAGYRVGGMLPMLTMDGINDAGVSICANALPRGNGGDTLGTLSVEDTAFDEPDFSRTDRLCTVFIPRFVLDRADSAAHAVELLAGRDIFSIQGMEFHWLISDASESYVVECVDNRLVALRKSDNAVMTNYSVSRSPHSSEYTALLGGEAVAADYYPRAAGIERFEAIADALPAIGAADAMLAELRKTWFTKMYDADCEGLFWSDLNGRTSLGGDHVFSVGDDDEWASARRELFADMRERYAGFLGGTGVADDIVHTIHSSAYGLDEKSVLVCVQERPIMFRFTLGEAAFSELTAVTVDGDGIGAAVRSDIAGARWEYDAASRTLTLLDHHAYAVNGLADSGIRLKLTNGATVIGMKIGLSISIR